MTRGAEIQRPVLAGRQAVDALWWPTAWHGESMRREIVLASWCEGAALHRFEDGDLLIWPTSRWEDCGALGAWPLRRQHGALCSAQMSSEEWRERVAGLDGSDGSGHGLLVADAWLAEGGRLRPLRFDDARRVDPSEWLDADTPLIEPFDLTQPAREAAFVLAPRDLREVLGPDVPGETAGATREMLEALRKAGAASARRGSGSSGASGDRGGASPGSFNGGGAEGGWTTLRIVLSAFAVITVMRMCAEDRPAAANFKTDWALPITVLVCAAFFGLIAYLALLARGKGGRPGRGTGGKAGPGQRAGGVGGGGGVGGRPSIVGAAAGVAARVVDRAARALSATGLPERLNRAGIRPQAWRQWAARVAATTGLMSMIGARNAAYMRRVLRMFDDDQLKDALRHAPPLGGGPGDGALGQGFLLGARHSLSLNAANTPATAGMVFGDELMSHLRQLYRKTAERLEAQGRFDEAAYVHAVLLGEKQGALDMLERHGQLAKAAELALSWDMPAAVIVRYYALAGDWRQAVRVARRDRAFADAVVALEKRWPDPARRLRVEWAESLAARGELREAIRVIWPVQEVEARERAATWLAAVESAGGAEAARAIVWRAQAWPETLASHQDALEHWLYEPNRTVERAAMADELLGLSEAGPWAHRLALMLAGPMLEDQVRLDPPPLHFDQIARLTRMATDPSFAADLPAIKRSLIDREPQALSTRSSPLVGAMPEAGGLPVRDALPLPDGEWLLALGESGVVRLDARGRRRAHLPVPADRLVGAFDGGSALLLAARPSGDAHDWRVTRLVVPEERLVDLGSHRFDAFSTQFDGETWTVAEGRRVRVLDVLSPMLGEVLWQVADLPGPVRAVDTRQEQEVWWLVGEDRIYGGERWRYGLPTRRLQGRDPLEVLMPLKEGVEPVRRVAISDGDLLDLHPGVNEAGMRVWQPMDPTNPKRTFPELSREDRLVIGLGGRWAACCVFELAPDTQVATVCGIELVCLVTGRLHARWPWPSSQPPRARHFRGTWMIFDDEGRVAALDTDTCRTWSLSSAGRA